MSWADIWRFIQSWEGIVTSLLAIAAAIYYGPKKMLEVWDWYVYRFLDSDVLLVLKDRKTVTFTTFSDSSPLVTSGKREGPYTESELAQKLNRSQSSVAKSLKRLYAHDKIEKYEWGWRLKG